MTTPSKSYQKHPPGGLAYRYKIKSIPSLEVSAEQKQQALVDVVERLSGTSLARAPRPPQFRTDHFCCRDVSSRELHFPVLWTLIDRSMLDPQFRKAPPDDDDTPEKHMGWDDDIGIGATFSGVAGCGPDLSWIVQSFMAAALPIFDAYRADAEPIELSDHDRANAEGLACWQHYRWRVHGVTSACFYDDRVCRSAFGIDAATVAKRVEGEVPFVQVLQLRNRQGVLMQTVEQFVDVAGLLPVRARVMAAIRGERTAGSH